MIGFADWGMRGELAEIWQICFDEPAHPAKFFLNNGFRPENCLIYRIGGKIAAVLYLLPACLLENSEPVQAHYIYAAATLPQYRGRGCMSALLAWAALVGVNRGDRYSIVLPESRELYGFYEKAEYRSFFQVRNVSVSLSHLCDRAQSGRSGKFIFSWQQLNSLRTACLAGQNGSVLWSEEAFGFAVGLEKIYGDTLVCSRTDNRPAYALCHREDEDTCRVTEIMAEEDTLADLLAGLICAMPAQTYSFRLPVGSRLFAEEGIVSAFGMLRALGGELPETLRSAHAPYLGLALD